MMFKGFAGLLLKDLVQYLGVTLVLDLSSEVWVLHNIYDSVVNNTQQSGQRKHLVGVRIGEPKSRKQVVEILVDGYVTVTILLLICLQWLYQ